MRNPGMTRGHGILPCFGSIFLKRIFKLHLVVKFHWLLLVTLSTKRRNFSLNWHSFPPWKALTSGLLSRTISYELDKKSKTFCSKAALSTLGLL